MSLNETYSGWISHFVNQCGYLKSIRKSKICCLFSHACWWLFDALKCITQLRCFSTTTQLVTSLDAGQQSLIIIVIIFIRIIIITSECVKQKNKSHWRRKFSFSAQIIALNSGPDLPKAMFTTYLHDNGHRLSNTKKAVTPMMQPDCDLSPR